ncbi:uncharacterized protein LOC130625457 [Hydractinia symbiolongicarpus]|uniref:uncharacterized protein LOC130625457 n=1 Tax=Hydractinia symbiolongicarpus TaxID=13093 RepID=UPI00254DCFC1|nr:uncharacterized protein LOC130625457 [Hydractinia symbiolongicarpus]
MIFYIIMLCLHTCHCITVARGERIETAKGGVAACRNTCTCRSPSATFFYVRGEEKCIGANGTGCLLTVDGYTTDVPLITQKMVNKTMFRITKDGGNLCPNTLDTNGASSVRMLALTDQWEVVPTFMSNSILYSIPIVKEVMVNYHAVWPGLLIKLEVRCKASNGNEYTLRENCVLFKYEGTATYPLTLSSFAPITTTATTPVTETKTTTETTTTKTTTKTATTTTTETTNLNKKAKENSSSASTTSTTGRTDANSNESTSSTLPCEYNKSVFIVGGILGVTNLIFIIIVIFLVREVKNRGQTKVKEISSINVTESSFVYEYPEVKVNKTASGEEQGNGNWSCQNVTDNKNYAPLIFDSKENVKSNYTTLLKDGYEIPMKGTVEVP